MRHRLVACLRAGLSCLILLAGPVARAAGQEGLLVPGDAGTFTLRDGGTITGRLTRTGDEGAVVELADEAQVRFPPSAITGLREGGTRAGETTRIRAVRRDGKALEGTVVSRTPGSITIRVADGERLGVPWDDVRSLEYLGAVSTGPSWARAPADGPARNRTLFAPTGFLLEPGELQLSVTGVVQPTLSAGILPFLGASAWTVIPVLQASGYPGTGALLVNGGLSPLPWLHLMAGVQGVVESGGLTVAPILAATFGTPRAYANLALAPTPVGASRAGQFEKGALAASGGVALTSWGMLLAEAWLGKSYAGGVSAQVGGAARVWWGVAGAELGATWLSGGGGAYVFASLVLDMNLAAPKEQP
ncbi:MAG: hypothetical protein WB493_12775 [Anaeromyxobacteraceae bacterium]